MFVSVQTKQGLVKKINLNAIISIMFVEKKEAHNQLLHELPPTLTLPILQLETAKEANIHDGEIAQELYDFITEALQHTGLLKHAFEVNEKGECEYHLLPEKTFFDEQ